MADRDTEQKRGAAPYISFATLKTFIAPLKEHVIPNRIDKSLLRSFSGSVQPQLIAAIKFLELIHDDGRPTDSLKKLVSAFGTDEWEKELRAILAYSYAALFEIPLATVSPSQFNEEFKKAYPCEGETLSKGVRFFLTAGRDAGVTFSPFLIKNAKPRSGATKRRGRPAAKNRPKDGDSDGTNNNHKPPIVQPLASAEDPWLAKYPPFDPAWGPEIQKSWFAGYSELMNLRKKAK